MGGIDPKTALCEFVVKILFFLRLFLKKRTFLYRNLRIEFYILLCYGTIWAIYHMPQFDTRIYFRKQLYLC